MLRHRACLTTALLLALSATAHAAVVEQAYTATITHYAARDGDWRVIDGLQLGQGQTISGVVRYDNALGGTTTQTFPPETIYRGDKLDNHLTASINGQVLWGTPTATQSGCSPLQISCGLIPSAPAALPEVASLSFDRQYLTFKDTRSSAAPGPFFTVDSTATSPLSLTSLTLTFAWRQPPAMTMLPAGLNLLDTQFTSLTMKLSDGSAVFAQLSSLAAPVPEAATLWSFGLGLLALGLLRRTNRAR